MNISFLKNVRDLLVSVNVLQRNVRIQIDSLIKPTQLCTMRSRHMTHERALALNCHNLSALKDKQMSLITGVWCVWWNVVNGILCGL